MDVQSDIDTFFRVALSGDVHPLTTLTVTVVVTQIHRHKHSASLSSDSGCARSTSTADHIRNILLNKILHKGQEIAFQTSKTAHICGITDIVVDSCEAKSGDADTDTNAPVESSGLLTQTTAVKVASVVSKDFYDLRRSLRLENMALAGISPEAEKLRKLIRFSQSKSSFQSHRQVGVLLHGPSGCGKSSLVKYFARQCDAVVISVDQTQLLSSESGSGPAALRQIFRRATRLAEEEEDEGQGHSVILFLDDVEALCPHRDTAGQGSRQLTNSLISEFDRLHHAATPPGLLVVGATSSIGSVDPSLRRPGRFGREILINIPTRSERLSILTLLTSGLTLTPDIDLRDLSSMTPGYTGADLAGLCEEMVNQALLRTAELKPPSEAVTSVDVTTALHCVVPLMKRGTDCAVDLQPVAWADIGGYEDIKQEIRQTIEWPLLHPSTLRRLDLRPTKGLLLHGPPGCCKTTLVRAAATSCHVTFLTLSGAQVFSPYVGESEKIISEAFQKARALSPSILFFDEMETLVGKRSSENRQSKVQERILATLLNEMDGVGIRLDRKTDGSVAGGSSSSSSVAGEAEKEVCGQEVGVEEGGGGQRPCAAGDPALSLDLCSSQVMVVGATNRPDMLDPAILRPGRLDKHVYVPPPDMEARTAILQVYTSKMAVRDLDMEEMSRDTENYTGADLKNLCKEAGLFAIREMMSADSRIDDDKHLQELSVTGKHFNLAKQVVKPSL